ncbi:DUF3822 family protein [Olivibacter sp. SDN3]|uniref:DUF3822 family protein n=1 Tax=Olivibacter sp. SDN3 TaxID=2764720 RepID=UPI0016517548|nr:DUF3822 family protein [Olivibacter sp. SDN3]QNL48436.1 DUF3822 family protein [Olivibacter sp. SDN3]
MMSELLRIEFIDDNFTVEKSEDYQLFIQLGEIRNQLSILDNSHALLLLLSWQNDLEEDRVNHLLNLPYKSKQIIYNNNNILLIPKELYTEQQNIYYLNLLCLSKQQHKLLGNSTCNQRIQCLYSAPYDTLRAVENMYKEFDVISRSAILLNVLQKQLRGEDTVLAINFEESASDFTYFESGELIYHAVQPTVDADEFNFFLLTIVEQLNIKLVDTSILVTGKVDEKSDYYKRLTKYSTRVRFLDLTDQVQCSNSLIIDKLYRNVTLLGLSCV